MTQGFTVPAYHLPSRISERSSHHASHASRPFQNTDWLAVRSAKMAVKLPKALCRASSRSYCMYSHANAERKSSWHAVVTKWPFLLHALSCTCRIRIHLTCSCHHASHASRLFQNPDWLAVLKAKMAVKVPNGQSCWMHCHAHAEKGSSRHVVATSTGMYSRIALVEAAPRGAQAKRTID